MDNKKLGIMLIIVCLFLGVIIFAFDKQLNEQTEASCNCKYMYGDGMCPAQKQNRWQTYLGTVLVSGIAALGIYLIFFEKSQKEIISTLKMQKPTGTALSHFC